MDYESAAHLAPTPSYALESSDGESDYEDEAVYSTADRVTAAPRRRKPLKPEAEVTFSGATDKVRQGGEVIFLVGEAGERMAQGVQLEGDEASGATISVLVDGEQAGLISAATGTHSLVFLSTALPLAALHPLAAHVLELLQPSTVTILASYHLPSYIPANPTPSPGAPVLYLASPSPAPAIEKLVSSGTLQPFTPPNLLHGVPAALLALASLSDSVSNSTLLLLPTTTPPPPLNGPFPPTSPITNSGGSSMYDAGGPTGLGEPGALFREVAGGTAQRGLGGGDGVRKAPPLQAVKEALGWSWWDAASQGGKGFEWLERQRKQRRKSEFSSMFM
ncbi:hypothetical protein JCM10908_001252 [Rhodotorula pacifica]|uniref:uncharacterized protein n=1 Tax=Rhodotorula pacifica TaxID=1495444 RepID=UPI00317AF700